MAFSDKAHWRGKLLKDMTQEQLIEALYQKTMELRWCYETMSTTQMRVVADRLKDAEWN